MGRFFEYDNESEIRDILEDEVSDILSETSPLLQEVNNASPRYKDSKLYTIVKKYVNDIYINISSQIEAIKDDASNQIEDLISARDTHISNCIDLKNEIDDLEIKLRKSLDLADELGEEVKRLQEENQLFREGKHGTVHGKKYDI